MGTDPDFRPRYQEAAAEIGVCPRFTYNGAPNRIRPPAWQTKPKPSTSPRLETLCAAALEAAGARAEDAAACVRILIDAELMGISTHGAVRVPDYARRLRGGGIDARATPKLERRAPSLALVDGANALGPVVGLRALEAGLEMARETGIAYVGCRASNHFGAIAPYGRIACEAGFVMLAGTNASTTMPPAGGKALRLGNNPLCIAAPGEGGAHFILDMATERRRARQDPRRAQGRAPDSRGLGRRQGRPPHHRPGRGAGRVPAAPRRAQGLGPVDGGRPALGRALGRALSDRRRDLGRQRDRGAGHGAFLPAHRPRAPHRARGLRRRDGALSRARQADPRRRPFRAGAAAGRARARAPRAGARARRELPAALLAELRAARR